MLYTSTGRSNKRKGLALLLVITMLGLFAVVALSFVYYAEAEASSSTLSSLANNKTVPDSDPEMLLAYYLRQLLYDSDDNRYSAMLGHSLARTMWGSKNGGTYNGIGRLHYTNATVGGGDDYYYPNYQYFPLDGFIRDPEYYGTRNPGLQAAPNPALYRAGNAPYTYPDMNNMFLARVDTDSATGLPVVITPSFHRQYLTPSTKYSVLYPTTIYNPNFNPPDTDPNTGAHVRNLDNSLGMIYVDPKTQAVSYYNNDSYWMDLGFPYMIAPNGKKYKPLFASLVVDLDNRLNVLAAGNNRGTDPVSKSQFHVSNRGYGSTEMNLNYLWFLQNLTPGTFTAPNNVKMPAMSAEVSRLINSRASAAGPPGTWPLRDGPAYARIDFDGLNSGPIQLPGSYGTAPNTYFTMPNYPSPLAPGAPYLPYPWYSVDSQSVVPLELQNHPLAFTNYNAVSAANLEAIMRHRGTNAPAITSDLFVNMPQTFANSFLRNQLTPISWNIDRTTAAPYRTYSPNGTYQYNPTKLYPQGPSFASPLFDGSYVPPAGAEFNANFNGTLGGQIRVNLNRIHASINGLPQFDYPTPNGTGYIDLTRPTVAKQFAVAQAARQQLAGDIYRTFLGVTGAQDPNLSTQVTAASNGQNFTPAAINVISTAGFPAAGIINVNVGAGVLVPVAYTGTTPTSFTGCTGGTMGALATGQVVTNAALTTTSAQFLAARWLAQLSVNIVDYIDNDDIITPLQWYTDPNGINPAEFVFGTELPRLVLNEAYAQVDNDPTDPMLGPVLGGVKGSSVNQYRLNVWTELANPFSGIPNTTIAAGSDLQVLPPAAPPTIVNVVSTAGFPTSGIIYIRLFGGSLTTVRYTGTTPTSFTGCTGGNGTLHLGEVVSAEASPMDFGLARLTVGMPMPILPIDPMSAGTVLPPATPVTIYVTDPTNVITQFPQAGTLAINIGGTWTTVDYTGWAVATMTTPACFTGCTGGNGILAALQPVKPYNAAYRITLDQQDSSLRDPTVQNNTGNAAFQLNSPTFWDPAAGSVTVLPGNGQQQEGGTFTKNNGFFVVGPSQLPNPTFPGNRDPGFTATMSYPSGQMSVPFIVPAGSLNTGADPMGDPVKGLIPKGTTVLLRRLACPYIPPQPNPLAPNYNPYITVDYAQNVKTWDSRVALGGTIVTPPAETSYYAVGRMQPYAADQFFPQNNAPPGQPRNTFFQQNNPLTTPFNWLVHLDRPVVNSIELMHVSGFRPHELTQQFITFSLDVNGNLQQTPYTHYAPWLDHSTLIYRALEMLGVPTYQSYNIDPVTNMPAPGGRVPGRININTLNDVFLKDPATSLSVPPIFTALADPQNATPMNVSSFTQQDVINIYTAMIASRTPGNAKLGIPAGMPGPADAPFRSFASGWIPSAAGDTQYPQGAGLHDTLLRTVTINGNAQRLMTLPGAGHPYKQLELLQKIYNNVTTTSNVFAVWLTVGFFEVDDTVTPPALKGELGFDQGRNIRHRFFAVVDRSVLPGYPGPQVNYNPRRDPYGAVLYFSVIK
jgi:hypothetical protein